MEEPVQGSCDLRAWEFAQVSNSWPGYNWSTVCLEDADWDSGRSGSPEFLLQGVEVRWYKRFGRSMNVNVVWPAEKWVRWFERCRQTLRAWEDSEGRPSPRDRVPYPDPSGAVSLAAEREDLRHVELIDRIRTLNAQLTCVACVCIDVSHGEEPRFTAEDWRYCHALDWVVRLGRHALQAPGRLRLHDSEE